MSQLYASDLTAHLATAPLISTDVFDTLLLRTSRSERSRIALGERMFAKALRQLGFALDPDLLLDARLEAQQLAFRALNVGDRGEVTLSALVLRQLKLLGLPERLAPTRLQIELEVEKTSLAANHALAAALRARRRAGARVIAVSDTTLSAAALRTLIQHFHGDALIDQIYSSADLGRTKRRGDLFATVAEQEGVSPAQIIHIGDDYAADVQAATAQGLAAHHTPREAYRGRVRKLDGAITAVRRAARSRANPQEPGYHDAYTFGRVVLGPVTAHFCQRIWLYTTQAASTHEPVLLFCARGGLGIRAAFELVVNKLQLSTVRRDNLMISRVVAARTAVAARSPAATQELDREFHAGTLADAARALGSRDYLLEGSWNAPFNGEAFMTLLFGPSGAEVLADIQRQNALFDRHFRQLIGNADRVILCDTGLYGSTQRMLAAGYPQLVVETVQFARSNYKGHGEEHFPRVAGLLVERTGYHPLDVASSVLRYWHLIESLFEPAIESVRWFEEDDTNTVRCNAGDIAFGAVDPAQENALLAGVLAYLQELPAGAGARMRSDALTAWHQLRRAITQPTDVDVHCLSVGERSVDFGRARRVQGTGQPPTGGGLHLRMQRVKTQLWREGAIALEFPILKHALLPLLGGVQSLRGMRHRALP
ncbi:MAG TPA: HAD family hydrolase [Polyangiales bacterium]